MQQRAEQNTAQEQTLSARQVQSLAVLSMSNDELSDFVSREQEENPFLEIGEGGIVRERMTETAAFLSGGTAVSRGTGGGISYDIAAPETATLAEYLHSQMDERTLSVDERHIVDFVIDSLDEQGYLTISAKEVSLLTHSSVALVQQCIERIRALEPAGVAADSLAQCLELQLIRLGAWDETTARILRYHLEDVAAGHIGDIARSTGISRERVQKCIDRIRTLSPHPASGFGSAGTQFIVPDLTVSWQDGAWSIEINDSWMGSIGISRLYEGLMRSVDEPEVAAYFTQRIARARFVVECIEKRRGTLTGIARVLCARQDPFLRGIGALRPMTFHHMAEALGVHDSTISRAVRDKYIQTPRGSMPLRSLFTAAIGTDDEISRDSAVQLIRTLIAAEDKAHPLSDSALAERLNETGIHLSRRTVAKYRDGLGIPGTAQRKIRK